MNQEALGWGEVSSWTKNRTEGCSSVSQGALQAQLLLSSSPVPEPGGPGLEWGYQGPPWPEQCSGPRGQSEEGEKAAPVPGWPLL